MAVRVIGVVKAKIPSTFRLAECVGSILLLIAIQPTAAIEPFPPRVSVSLLVNEESSVALAHNAPFTVTWSSSNASSCAGSIKIGNAAPKAWAGITPNSSGSSHGSLPGGGRTYTLTCVGLDGQSVTRTAKVLVTTLPRPSEWPDAPGAPVGDVHSEMAPFRAAAGSDAAAWLSGDLLGTYLYGLQAPDVLHGSGSIGVTESTLGHERIPCSSVAALDNLGVILIAGQSNAANNAQADANGRFYASNSPVYNLNIEDGKCYGGKEPLLGSDGRGQSFGLPLADDLIQGGMFKAVLLVPIAMSGTFIEQWKPSAGYLFARFEVARRDLKDLGLQPSMILWHQGEADGGEYIHNDTPDGTSILITRDLALAGTLNWMQAFFEIVSGIRAMGIGAPIFVAVATSCGSSDTSPEIQLAQTKVTDPAWGIYPGPDTDAIKFSLRRSDDQCHFSSEGNIIHAQVWFEVVQKYATSHPFPSSMLPDIDRGLGRKLILFLRQSFYLGRR